MNTQKFQRLLALALCMGTTFLLLQMYWERNIEISLFFAALQIPVFILLYRNKRVKRYLAIELVWAVIILTIISMDFFFKTESPPIQNKLQRTLAIIKPDAVEAGHTNDILIQIKNNDFRIVDQKQLTIDKATAQQFYATHKNRPFFNDLVTYITSGPSVVLMLERINAVQVWRNLMGATDPQKADPGTTRQLYGTDIQHNAVHGSDSPENAEREMAIFFPRS